MKLTIYEIKRRVKATGSHFFDRKTLKFFNQTLKDFSVINTPAGAIISAPLRDWNGRTIRMSQREFISKTNKLEMVY